MAVYMLDTHVLIQIGNRGGFESMPKKVRRILGEAGNELCISTISEFEIAQKFRRGKLDLPKHELTRICEEAGIRSYPFRQRHSLHLYDLPFHHADPFDRMIISHALVEGIPLISRDEQFRKYDGLKVISS